MCPGRIYSPLEYKTKSDRYLLTRKGKLSRELSLGPGHGVVDSALVICSQVIGYLLVSDSSLYHPGACLVGASFLSCVLTPPHTPRPGLSCIPSQYPKGLTRLLV